MKTQNFSLEINRIAFINLKLNIATRWTLVIFLRICLKATYQTSKGSCYDVAVTITHIFLVCLIV